MAARKKARLGGSRKFVLYTAIVIVVGVALFGINQQTNKGEQLSESVGSAPSTAAQGGIH